MGLVLTIPLPKWTVFHYQNPSNYSPKMGVIVITCYKIPPAEHYFPLHASHCYLVSSHTFPLKRTSELQMKKKNSILKQCKSCYSFQDKQGSCSFFPKDLHPIFFSDTVLSTIPHILWFSALSQCYNTFMHHQYGNSPFLYICQTFSPNYFIINKHP